MKFYVGQLLKHDFDPGVFRVLTVLKYAVEVEEVNPYYEDQKYISTPYWVSKAGWREA